MSSYPRQLTVPHVKKTPPIIRVRKRNKLDNWQLAPIVAVAVAVVVVVVVVIVDVVVVVVVV